MANKPAPVALHTHYVSIHNGVVYPAMTSPEGHEDNNPSDWRPATPQEIEAYLAGDRQVDVSPLPVDVSAPVESAASPSSLRLEDGPPTAVQEAPVVPPVAPPPPAPAIPTPAPAIPPAPAAE